MDMFQAVNVATTAAVPPSPQYTSPVAGADADGTRSPSAAFTHAVVSLDQTMLSWPHTTIPHIPLQSSEEVTFDDSSVKTPTRDSFAAQLRQQKHDQLGPKLHPPHSTTGTQAASLTTARSTSRSSNRSRNIDVDGNSSNDSNDASTTATIALSSSLPATAWKADDAASHPSEASLEDVEMADDDDDDDRFDMNAGQEIAGSDNDSGASDSRPPSKKKKKKGQRFFCTEFPPCHLSFTRSEHLARHIRKHTGERPFQCHCSRRFSRLDNLRQHAQTVHVNEDIPGDSLAATGTRFQRQIRTDRVRPPTSRSRASTLGGSGGGGGGGGGGANPASHSRGHARNLSSSSVTSSTSGIGGQRDDFVRHRPQSLAIASESPSSRAHRVRLSLDTYTSHGTSSPIHANPDSGLSTPTSATFSGGAGSPRVGIASTRQPGLHSPAPSHAAHRPLTWAGVPSTARLSMNSASGYAHASSPAPDLMYYPPPPPLPPPPQHVSQQLLHTVTTPESLSHSIHSAATGNSTSYVESPTNSVSSGHRRDSSGTAEADWRRRTWHPGTYPPTHRRPSTSGVTAVTIGTMSQNSAGAVQQPPLRLPGIESFDRAPLGSSIPNRRPREPSPMQIDSPYRPPPNANQAHAQSAHIERPTTATSEQWDLSIRRGLTSLDLANATPPAESPDENHRQDQRKQQHAPLVQPGGLPSASLSAISTPQRHRHHGHSMSMGNLSHAPISTTARSGYFPPVGPTSYPHVNDFSTSPPRHRHTPSSGHVADGPQPATVTVTPLDQTSSITESNALNTTTNRRNKRQGWYRGPPPVSESDTTSSKNSSDYVSNFPGPTSNGLSQSVISQRPSLPTRRTDGSTPARSGHSYQRHLSTLSQPMDNHNSIAESRDLQFGGANRYFPTDGGPVGAPADLLMSSTLVNRGAHSHAPACANNTTNGGQSQAFQTDAPSAFGSAIATASDRSARDSHKIYRLNEISLENGPGPVEHSVQRAVATPPTQYELQYSRHNTSNSLLPRQVISAVPSSMRQPPPSTPAHDLRRLDVLVAVATGERQAATAMVP